MRRVASHRIILPDGRVLRNHVAVLDDDDRLLSFHPLQGEEPFTEWVEGEYRVKSLE